MLVIDERAADRPDPQAAYFDGSLELLRELAVTFDVDAALPRLSEIVTTMGYIMRRSKLITRILREQWTYFVPSSLTRGR